MSVDLIVSRGIAANDAAIGLATCTQGEVERRVRELLGLQVVEDVIKAMETRISLGEGAPREKLDQWAEDLRKVLQQQDMSAWVWALVRCLRGWEKLSLWRDGP